MQPTKNTQFIVSAIVIYIFFGSSIWADSLIPKVAPITDIYIPQGEYKQLAPARPLTEYPLIKETPKSYLILYKRGANTIIGLIPKSDRLNNPTANVDGNKVVIRSLANTAIYEGSTPYEKNKRYDVVGESATGYKVKFTSGEYSAVCELPKTSVVYISEADLRREQEAALRKEEERKIEAAKQATEKLKREQEAAAIAQQRRQEMEAAEQQRRQEAAASEQKKRQEEAAAELLRQQDDAALTTGAGEQAAENQQEGASGMQYQQEGVASPAEVGERFAENPPGRVLSAVDIYKRLGATRLFQLVAGSPGSPPPSPVRTTEHNVADIVAYINDKLNFGDPVFGDRRAQVMLKYISKINQWAIVQNYPGTDRVQGVVIFKPELLDKNKMMVETTTATEYGITSKYYSLKIYSLNNKPNIVIGFDDSAMQASTISLPVQDSEDGKKISQAFQELIHAFGGLDEMY